VGLIVILVALAFVNASILTLCSPIMLSTSSGTFGFKEMDLIAADPIKILSDDIGIFAVQGMTVSHIGLKEYFSESKPKIYNYYVLIRIPADQMERFIVDNGILTESVDDNDSYWFDYLYLYEKFKWWAFPLADFDRCLFKLDLTLDLRDQPLIFIVSKEKDGMIDVRIIRNINLAD
jgi:hypothetical protein